MAMPVPRTLVSCFSFRASSSVPSKRMEPRTLAPFGQQAHGGQRGDRLARARFADDAEDLAGREGQVHAAHGVDHAVLGGEVDLEPARSAGPAQASGPHPALLGVERLAQAVADRGRSRG